MALNTGKKITRRTWDELPIIDLVIARVNELGRDMPTDLIFTDKHAMSKFQEWIPKNPTNPPTFTKNQRSLTQNRLARMVSSSQEWTS